MSGQSRHAHVVGFDDAPFPPRFRGEILLVGAVFAGTRLEGILSTTVRRDGNDATERIAGCLGHSRFLPQLQAVLLQGVAFAGFNVVDVPALHRALGLPVVVVSRKQPDFAAIERALLERVPGGVRKWESIRALGPMERAGALFVQRAGLSLASCEDLLRHLTCHGKMPEPLRTAHLVAGGIALGESRHRP